jgi:hypothetical protein
MDEGADPKDSGKQDKLYPVSLLTPFALSLCDIATGMVQKTKAVPASM